MNTVPTTRPATNASTTGLPSPILVSTLVQVVAHRARLPALRPASRTSSPDALTRYRQPCSTASSPAQGSAPHSGRCSATAGSA